MEIMVSVLLLGSIILATILFLISTYYTFQSNMRWMKFMALGLLSLAVSCTIIIFFGAVDNMAKFQVSDLVIADLVFIGFSALFYWSYNLTKNKEGGKKV